MARHHEERRVMWRAALVPAILFASWSLGMAAFAAQLNDQQITDITNDVRSSRGNTAPPNATAATVAALRAQSR
jgi:mono/diheme cytochrome c family protein